VFFLHPAVVQKDMDSPLLDLKNKPELHSIAIKMFQHILKPFIPSPSSSFRLLSPLFNLAPRSYVFIVP